VGAVISRGVRIGSKTLCGTLRCTSGLSSVGVGAGVSDGVAIGVPVGPCVPGSGPQARVRTGTSARAAQRKCESYRRWLRKRTEILHGSCGPPA
jgi:hypothetical protein